MSRNGDVWLGVAGLVIKDGQILVVKKSYGATQGLWTLPGGFVSPTETMDEAVLRELKEETNVEAEVKGVIGIRTGVLRTGISDNLILFYLDYLSGELKPRLGEIQEAAFLSYSELVNDSLTTEFLLKAVDTYFIKKLMLDKVQFMPKRDYGYRSYKVFI